MFGDSLSDDGNVSLIRRFRRRPAPMFDSNFSNGPVCGAGFLPPGLGLAAPARFPALPAGSDYAFGRRDDRIRLDGPTGRPNLAATGRHVLLSHASAPSNALYTFSIGANDLFNILDGSTGGLTPLQAAAAAAHVVASEAGDLEAAGAKDLALFDVPDLGVTPGFKALVRPPPRRPPPFRPISMSKCCWTWRRSRPPGSRSFDLNTFALIDKAVQDPGAFGFSNVTAPCWTGGFTGSATGGSLCSTLPAVQDTYLFWDDVHPTAAGQLLVADAALRAIGLPVPEPSTWAMMALGFGGLGFAGYRARARAAA